MSKIEDGVQEMINKAFGKHNESRHQPMYKSIIELRDRLDDLERDERDTLRANEIAAGAIIALSTFPQPGMPGDQKWVEKVIQWWNETARDVLMKG